MGIIVWTEVERSPENEPNGGILSFAFYQKIFTVEMQFNLFYSKLFNSDKCSWSLLHRVSHGLFQKAFLLLSI